MKKFLKKTGIFFIILIIILSMIFIFTNKIINNNSSFFKIKPSIKHLVLGHSHPACSLNDQLILNTKNVSSSGELYFYTYLKAKKIIKENKELNTIFLEFTNNQITRDMKKWTLDEKQIIYRLPLLSPVMDMEDWAYIFKKNQFAVLKASQYILKSNLKYLFKKNTNYVDMWGGYEYSKENHIDSLSLALKKGKLKVHDVSFFEDVNLVYLDKIIELCKKKKINIILIRSPFHKKYQGFNNENLFTGVLKSRFSNISFLDFKYFPLNDSEYKDFEHLNFKGAKKFSLFFNELIKDSILEKENMQFIINQKMNNF